MSDDNLRFLVVCTGNICRSPLAEQVLRAETVAWPVILESAGTQALEGHSMETESRIQSESFGGLGCESHLARQLLPSQIRAADVIIALTREHRREIVSMVPRASRLTFTLRELGRLLPLLTDRDYVEIVSRGDASARDRLLMMFELCASLRGSTVRLERPEDDDVVDPYGRDREVYAQATAQMLPAISVISASMTSALGLPLER